MNYQFESVDELFEKRAQERYKKAQMSFDEKLQVLRKMQLMNYALKKSSGRRAPRPWCMPEEIYEKEMSSLDADQIQ